MFHNIAKCIIQSTQTAQQMHVCEMCLSHVIHYISPDVVFITRVIYKITRRSNKLLKCLSEHFSLTATETCP